MTIPVQQSLAGFIARDADISFTDTGIIQVHFRVGAEHWRREQDGTFTKLENSFHDLLIFGRTAERAADRLRKGDQFLAHGYVETRSAEPPARPAEREAFIARRIGHDLARTTYDVDRAPATARQADQQAGRAEVLPTIHGVNAQSPAGAQQHVEPTSPPLTDRPAALRRGASLGHGIGL